MHKDLQDFIIQSRERGMTDEQIRQDLLKVGWDEKEINQAINPNFESIESGALIGVGGLLEKSWQIYKNRIWTFLGIMFTFLIPIFLIFIVFTLNKFINPIVGLILVMIFGISIFFISFWSQIALLYAIKERDQQIGIKNSFTKAWHKIASFWWIGFLKAFIVFGGMVLLIIPGIIFAVWFSLAIYVLVSEDLKGMNALFRSKHLVQGNWWKIVWRGLMISMIGFIISFILSLIIGIFNIPLVEKITGWIISLFLTPFIVTYMYLIYEDLKRLKTGLVFEVPKKGTRIGFTLIAAIGPMIIIGMIVLMIVVFGTIGAGMYWFQNRSSIMPTIQPQETQELIDNLQDQIVSQLPDAKETQSQAEIADWETYWNDEYGFEMKYPRDFIKKEDNTTSKLFTKTDGTDGHFWIFIEDNLEKLDATGIMDNYYKNDGYGYRYQDTFPTINGIKSYKQGRYNLGVIEKYYIPKDNKTYSIAFEFNFAVPNQQLKEEKISLIDQIISTLKFQDQQPQSQVNTKLPTLEELQNEISEQISQTQEQQQSCYTNQDCQSDDPMARIESICYGSPSKCIPFSTNDCVYNDGKCPVGCFNMQDNDCIEFVNCMEDHHCYDDDDSTEDICEVATRLCSYTKITECISADWYCPANCTANNDTDCR